MQLCQTDFSALDALAFDPSGALLFVGGNDQSTSRHFIRGARRCGRIFSSSETHIETYFAAYACGMP